MRLRFKLKYQVIILALLFSLAYTYFARRIDLLNTANLRTTDFFLRNRYFTSKVPAIAKDIVVVTINEEVLKKLKDQWPLNRGFTAYFLEKISVPASKPRVVAIDLVFSGKGDNKETDLWLAAALKSAGNVVIASYFNPNGELVLPEKSFIDSAKAIGFINSPRDADLLIRRSYPFVFLKDNTLSHSFILEILANTKDLDLKEAAYDRKANALNLISPKKESLLIPVDPRGYTTKINYLAKPEDFKTIPLWQVLAGLEPHETFKDKIILVGTNMEITHDLHPTPLGLMSGICINANFLMSLLLNRFLSEPPAKTNFAILFILALFIGFVTSNLSSLRGLVVLLAVLAGSYQATVKYLTQDILLDFFGIAVVSVFAYLAISIIEYIHILLENVQLKKLALTDGLTGLYVFRYFEVKLNRELKIALEDNKDLSLVIFDVDHFKKFNDNYGHNAGNEILKNIAAVLKNRCRRDDTICRFGGEEFIAILPHTNLEGAGKYGEAIRKTIEMFGFNWEGQNLKATVSGGAASLFNLEKRTAQELIKAADSALYAAKSAGRNRTVLMEKKPE